MKIAISLAVALLFIGCSEEKKGSVSSAETTKDVSSKQIEKKEEPKVEVIEAKVEVTEVKEAPVAEVTKEIVVVKSGETIFRTCAACHGLGAEKQALGKSQIIKGWESSKVENALNGYKDGTYGGAMKGVMKGQASVLSSDDIKAVAEYISKL